MTRSHFDAQMGRLIVLKGWPDEVEEYFPALIDVPDSVFTDAVGHALKTRAWFPAPAELRLDCDVVAPRTTYATAEPRVEELLEGGRTITFQNPFGGTPLTIHLTREWKHDCETCRDTSWAPFWCGENPDGSMLTRHCGRRYEHDAHSWVDPCTCLEWNPTIRRRKTAGAKYSHAPEKVTT